MLDKKIKINFFTIYIFAFLGWLATGTFYKLPYKFSDPNSALNIYIFVLLLLFCFSYSIGHMISLIKLECAEAADKEIFSIISGLTLSASFFHQKHLSEFILPIIGKYILMILLALGTVFVFKQTNKLIYRKFTNFFQEFSLACRFFLYVMATIILVLTTLLLFLDSFILKVLAMFGAT
ncbi:MAG: hypothetical protein NDI63_00590 [Pseudobdellovibrio sp.]|nr:hypothetical protein [Pseudobdellovibrio sp.]